MRRRRPPELPHPRCQALHLSLLDVAPPVATPAHAEPVDYDDYLPATVPADRLVLQPGDTLVVRLPTWAGEYDVDRTRERVREHLPAAIGVVVVKGDELAVIRPDTRHIVAIDESQPPVHYYAEPGGFEPEVLCGGRIDSPDGWFTRTTSTLSDVTCEACKANPVYRSVAVAVHWSDGLAKQHVDEAAQADPAEPRRNAAIRIARAFFETDTAVRRIPGPRWDSLQPETRALLANVVEDLLSRGVIVVGSDARR